MLRSKDADYATARSLQKSRFYRPKTTSTSINRLICRPNLYEEK